jgi:hypothetical protein
MARVYAPPVGQLLSVYHCRTDTDVCIGAVCYHDRIPTRAAHKGITLCRKQ